MKIASRRVLHCKNPTESRFSKFDKICAYLGDVSPDLDWSGIKFDGTASGHALSEALRLTKAVEVHTQLLQAQAQKVSLLIHEMAKEGKENSLNRLPAATTATDDGLQNAAKSTKELHTIDENAGVEDDRILPIEGPLASQFKFQEF